VTGLVRIDSDPVIAHLWSNGLPVGVGEKSPGFLKRHVAINTVLNLFCSKLGKLSALFD